MENRYKKLKVSQKLPADLEDMTDQYVTFLNTGEGLATGDDYYTTEIMLILNWCYRERLLPEETIQELREYYQYGGIKNG